MKNQNKILVVILSFIFLLSIALNILFISDNKDLQLQIEKRDKVFKERQTNDSILASQKSTNERIIEKYVDDCGIMIGGRKVTSDELLLYINKQIEENRQLEKELNLCKDSLSIYKTFNDLTKKNLKVNYKVSEDKTRRTISIDLPDDSLKIYKRIVKLAERDYGIVYQTELKDNTYVITKQFTKCDSALMIFKYYRNKLYKEDSGTWTIELPEKSKTENKKKK